MKTINLKSLILLILAASTYSCTTEDSVTSDGSSGITSQSIDIAQVSGQLASGTSFVLSGSTIDSTSGHRGHKGKRNGHHGILDGISMIAPTDELLAIVDAESASDFGGMRISSTGGATVTHYNADGQQVTLPLPAKDGPNGCSFSGNQHPDYDSLLTQIVKTEIDFGTGVTLKLDTIEIIRSGKIVIVRSREETSVTETTSFENYMVNGAKIEGTKVRVHEYDSAANTSTSTTTVVDGKITFADGAVSTWVSDRSRIAAVVLDDDGRPESGTITTEVSSSITAADGTVIYSHQSTTPLTENISCKRRHAPVSGILETHYRCNTVIVNFGDSTCENTTVTLSVNGVTTTRTIGR